MIRIVHGEAQTRQEATPRSMVVVIDALRASATLCALIHAGCESVRVAGSVEAALALKEKEPESLLVGEYDNRVPEGFDIDNSPTAIPGGEFGGRTAVFLSTNGARILLASEKAGKTLIGSPVNISVLTRWLVEELPAGWQLLLAAAGDKEERCDEDSASAVLLSEAIGPDIDPGQEELHNKWKSIIAASGLETLFRHSKHGKELVKRERGHDIAVCAAVDSIPAVPLVKKHEIVDGFPTCLITA